MNKKQDFKKLLNRDLFQKYFNNCLGFKLYSWFTSACNKE